MPDIRVSRRWRRLAFAKVFALLASLGTLAAQGAPQPQSQAPIFRAGVNFVSVDVFPRRDGKVVEGLTAGDFQIFEDGKPQKVETFEFVRIEPNPVDSDRRDPSNQADADRQARDPRNRVFVIYLDLAHTTLPGSHAARQPVVDFLTRTIGRRDLFGYMTAEVPVSQVVFGRRTETIEAELAKYWTWGQAERVPVPRTPAERRLVECALMFQARTGLSVEGTLLQLARDEALHVSLENLVSRLRDLRDERKNILFISEGWVPRGPRDELTNVSVSQGDKPTVGVGPGGKLGIGKSQQPFDTDYADCDTRIRRLASIDFEQRFRELLTKAREANVSFYPVDVGGLRTVSPIGGARSTLMTLAENTDGFAVTNTNDLQTGVRRIADDLAAYYLLGYYSTNAAADGRYRRIEVKLSVPRIDVSARRGYVAPIASSTAAASAAPAGPTPVDDALARLSMLRDTTEVATHAVITPSGLHVIADLTAPVLARPGWEKGAEVRVTARRGAEVASGAGVIAAGERSVAVVIPIGAPGEGAWQVSVDTVGPNGAIEARLNLDGSQARLVGQAIPWRGAQSLRVPFKPLADFRLTRNERLRVEWPVLDEADTRTVRLLDRKGAALGANLPFAALPVDRRALAVDLPMAALPEGEFVVELAVEKGGIAERRYFAFRVVR